MQSALKIIPNSLQCISVPQALKAFLLDGETKNLSPRTIDWYEERIGYFIQYLSRTTQTEPVPLSLVTEESVKIFIAYHKGRENQKKRGSQLSSYTVKGTVVGIKVFLKFLFNEGYLPLDIAGKIKTPRVQKKIIQTLPQEHIQSLLNALDKKTFTGFRNYCMLLTFLDTGIRLGELANLKVRQIDFQSGTLTVLGKGNKERSVPFGMSLRKSLEKYLVWRGEVPNQDILFVNQYGKKMELRRIGAMVEYYGKKAGITGVRMSPHTLRHTFAKMSLLAGMDAMTLQYILGHTSLEMVRNYVNLTSQEVAIHKNRFSLMDRMDLKSGVQRKKLWK